MIVHVSDVEVLNQLTWVDFENLSEATIAMDIAESLIARWFGRSAPEEALRAIRLDYLRHGNLFGLVYTAYGWSELKLVPQ